jgi:hypothetical protein
MRPHACAAAILFSAIVYAPGPGNGAPAKSSPNPTCPIHKVEPSSAHKERYFVDCSPGAFLEQFTQRKLSAAKRLLQTYIGKWMFVQGKILYIPPPSPKEKTREIEFEIDNCEISVTFDESWKQRIAKLKKGDLIVVAGQIDDANILAIEMPDLSLKNAEIIDSTARR